MESVPLGWVTKKAKKGGYPYMLWPVFSNQIALQHLTVQSYYQYFIIAILPVFAERVRFSQLLLPVERLL